MKMFVAALSALCIAGTAFGQGANEVGYDDGTTETSYKLTGPSGPSDWFNVNFHGDAAGTACQLIVDWNNSGSTTASRAAFGLYPNSTSFANTPDTANALVTVATAIPVGDGNGTFTYYSIPDVVLGSSSVHMATADNPGDSTAWLGTDTNGPPGARTFFSSNGYASGAVGPWSNNWMMRIGVCPPAGTNGCLLVNGKTSDSINMGGTICITFWGGPNAAFLLYLCFGGGPFFKIALPLVFTNTGSPFFPGPRPDAWTICTTVDCSFPVTTTLEFCTIYQDTLDTKPSGNPKLKISKSAFVHFDDPSGFCIGPAAGCYGQKDDGAIDFNIWKVQNPAGPSDWFNVNNGTSQSSSGITMITGMEISGFDFCGFGPCWEEVGEYAANLALDATGATPDINSPLSTLGSATACITPGSADGNAPYTFYDIPDFAPSTTAIYHAAVKWQTGDSCIWLGSDTDGTDTTVCAKTIPNSGEDSLWTLDAYGTPGNRFSAANWGIRTTWTP